ncbi:NAD(P)H-hydrate epimerase [Candidatus Dojkabacteria bacterium]|uniref:NAD(P)H-hydrate epimerase n=1 Tax=Candidatus Dojkabacteria bacterium TaxID=2099670 RepID=A0A955L486_9BACT|nr:NAD(P)H-hydrate epimerase [Candidatus Dojkabacteria bacterium]
MKIGYVNRSDIPAISVSQMKKIDRLMLEQIGVNIEMMMENAGRSLAEIARFMLDRSILNKNILIFAGKGNNGGGALAAARHLLDQGAKIDVYLSTELEKLNPATLKQAEILQKSGKNLEDFENGNLNEILRNISKADLIIDGLIGYGLNGDPKEPISDFIDFINNSKAKVLANDIPSGLNGDLGVAYDPCIKADATLTLALPKRGLYRSTADKYVGDLFVSSLTVPYNVYQHLGLELPIFYDLSEIVQILKS